MDKYTLTFLILIITSCNPGHFKSVRVNSGLDYGESHSCILFPQPSIGLIGGEVNKSTNDLDEHHKGYALFDAICWRSVDGGHNWKAQKITDGTFKELIIKDNIIYANINPADNDHKYKTYIYESRNYGKNWTFKCGIKTNIVRLHIKDSNWMIGNSSGELIETKDGGKNWNILKTNQYVGLEFYDNSHIYYFSYSKKIGFYDLLVRQDLYTGEEKRIILPEGFEGMNGKDNIMFCSKGKELRVYRINTDLSLSHLSSIKEGEPTSVSYIGINGKQIYIFVPFITTGLFRTNRSFYYSPDGGKSWKELGHKGYDAWTDNNITNYTDSCRFRIVFYKNIYTLGTFNTQVEK